MAFMELLSITTYKGTWIPDQKKTGQLKVYILNWVFVSSNFCIQWIVQNFNLFEYIRRLSHSLLCRLGYLVQVYLEAQRSCVQLTYGCRSSCNQFIIQKCCIAKTIQYANILKKTARYIILTQPDSKYNLKRILNIIRTDHGLWYQVHMKPRS